MTMTTAVAKPTLRDLRAEAKRLGITPESAGGPIEDLLRRAQENEDSLGFLAIHAPPEAMPAEAEPAPMEVGQVGIKMMDDSAGMEAAMEDAADRSDRLAQFLAGAKNSPKPDHERPVVTIATVTVTLPCAAEPIRDCYVGRHADVRMNRAQAEALRRLQLGLDARGDRLASGKRVITTADAVRWLLEQII